MSEEKDKKYQEAVNELQARTSSYELAKQNMRDIRSRLDSQIELFTRIHQYAQQAFHIKESKDLYPIIAEGIVDIFQVEIGAIFSLAVSGDNLCILGSCNLPDCSAISCNLPFPKEWIARQELWDFKKQKAVWESPVPDDSPWAALNLEHAIYMPLFNNNRGIEGMILGGITKQHKEFYDFTPDEILSSFMVYCQQMSGIYNNHAAILSANEADKAKSQFLANLSHEIRTPMNAIIGMVQIGLKESSPQELKKRLVQIGVSSRHLLGLLNDVLDLSKIEEGKLELNNEPFLLNDMTDNVLGSVNQNALNKKQKIITAYHGIKSFAYVGDAMRLSQVLINLLSNAVKFTPESGAIHLDIEELSRDKEKAFIKFAVTDTGIGINQEFLNRIFTPFEQADGSTSRKYGGTGLGLAISQRIVELMGGRIEVKNNEGAGACFSFSVWFPINEQTHQETAAEDSSLHQTPDFSPYRVLVVDDVDINREIVFSLLEDTKIQFDEASNGQEAIEKFAASAPGWYNLILMDVQMPVMDGYSATRAIRAMDREDAQQIPIIAMTANVFKEDVQQVLEAGMNKHIGKPVEYNTLLKALIQTFENR